MEKNKMEILIEIANSEGPHLAIAERNGRLYLMIKQNENNDYSFFPVTKERLVQFLDGKITVREMLPSFDSFMHIDKHYEEIRRSAWIEPKEKILSSIQSINHKKNTMSIRELLKPKSKSDVLKVLEENSLNPILLQLIKENDKAMINLWRF